MNQKSQNGYNANTLHPCDNKKLKYSRTTIVTRNKAVTERLDKREAY